jgi:uncharacterized repeat protein (TIGR03803 family)
MARCLFENAQAAIARLALFGMMAFITQAPSTAQASMLNILYSFCGVQYCANGEGPVGGLLRDSAGNVYGTTQSGGANGGGEVFELARSGDRYSFQVLYSFCPAGDCSDGSWPTSDLIMDTSGDLYGTTNSNSGSVFELVPNAKRTIWRLKTLHRFCSEPSCADGTAGNALTYAGAASGALYDGSAVLYGTTNRGGANDGGVVFTLKPPAPQKRKWHYNTIHDFCGPNCTEDGERPAAALTMDSSGHLYGTTVTGGIVRAGVVFELKRKRGKWVEILIYQFGSKTGDGGFPASQMLLDSAGNLFGTTALGGAHQGGTVFKLVPNGRNSQLETLYSFCAQSSCADGSGPSGDIAMDPGGNIYGITSYGGDPDQQGGVVYGLNPTFHVLHTFCSESYCQDGYWPVSGVILDGTGNVFGTTYQGGAHNGGEGFMLTP